MKLIVISIILILGLFQIQAGDEPKAIHEAMKQFPKTIEALKKNEEIVKLFEMHSAVFEAKETSDTDKICLSLDMIGILFPLYEKNNSPNLKLGETLDLIFGNLCIMNKEKQLNKQINIEIENLIGSYNYKAIMLNNLKIGVADSVEKKPLEKIKTLIKGPADFEVHDLTIIANDIDFYLYAKENKIEDKIEVCIASLEMYAKAQDIIKRVEDKSQTGWYAATSQFLKEFVLKKLTEFKFNEEYFACMKKYKERLSKNLSEDEIKNIFEVLPVKVK